MLPSKTDLMENLLARLRAELQVLEKSVASAAEAATHPESKPENKYDTRGLEASYLAGAQKERVAELKGALHFLQVLRPRTFAEQNPIAPTALVELVHEEQSSFYWLMVWGAGYVLELDGQTILTISPQSPIGQALLGKLEGDSFLLRTGAQSKEYQIVSVS
jgi:transcription elongation GreA/GreB family factor